MGKYCKPSCALLLFLISLWASQSCDGLGTFGFDIHHRYSDQVRGILDLDGLPEEGTVDYYAAMSHRDRLFHGRNLAGAVATRLTFAGGNSTYRINSLGYLHYANITVGTPDLWFLVALDTGSDLFWLPCDCVSCVGSLQTRTGGKIDLNVYSPNTSSTSNVVSCNGTVCSYNVTYVTSGTSSAGVLVEDVLHLTTDDSQLNVVDARITFGCGIVQTGILLKGAAPNGLVGLGVENIAVPSILASEGLTANSFSMCFGPSGKGRISFGDKGSSDQAETSYNFNQQHPTYNISVTHISVGKNVTDLSFSAIFDSGTAFTLLSEPAYTIISESFNSQAPDKRHQPDSSTPFEYCYDLSADQNITYPAVSLTMTGGNQFNVTHPISRVGSEGGAYIYCLSVVKSDGRNIIGQNFMTGHRIIFDRERMILGWKESDCYDASFNTLPINPGNSTVVPPASSVNPEATQSSSNGSHAPTGSPHLPASCSIALNSFGSVLLLALSFFSVHCFIILS